MLRVSKVEASYGEARALWEVSIEVEEGEITTIIGPNGAGKTTLLRTISGLLPVLKGEIFFLGDRIDKLPPNRIAEKGIALIPEDKNLFPNMTVTENLELGAYNHEARKIMKDSLELVYDLFPALQKMKNRCPKTLSGGEQRMLAIARGLMSRPKLLMLDEPSLGLMPKLTLKVFELTKKLNELGLTILLVEQNVHHSLELADKGYILENGRIVRQGTGDQLLQDDYVKKSYLGY